MIVWRVWFSILSAIARWLPTGALWIHVLPVPPVTLPARTPHLRALVTSTLRAGHARHRSATARPGRIAFSALPG